MPQKLDELIPRYLDQVPTSLPSIEVKQYRCANAAWGLTIYIPAAGFLMHEELVYIASEDYSSCHRKGALVGNWMFVSFPY